jgi:hypothetical protein
VVGRGSLPLELTTGSLVDPEGMALLPAPGAGPSTWTGDQPEHQVVVTARRAETGDVVGVVGGDGRLEAPAVVVVAPSATGEGVEDHLVARWRWVVKQS